LSHGVTLEPPAATPLEQLVRILVGLRDILALSFLQEKHYDDATVTLKVVAEVERFIRSHLTGGSVALDALAILPKRNNANAKVPRDNCKNKKAYEGRHEHSSRSFRRPQTKRMPLRPNAPAAVAATSTGNVCGRIRATCAADTIAVIQEAL
jgi:hypothetical protein